MVSRFEGGRFTFNALAHICAFPYPILSSCFSHLFSFYGQIVDAILCQVPLVHNLGMHYSLSYFILVLGVSTKCYKLLKV